MRIRLLTPVIAVAVVLVGGCSSGDDGGDDGAALGETVPSTEASVPDVPEVSPAGTGVVVIGRSSSTFSVTQCQLVEGGDPGVLLSLTGAGTSSSGVPFQVEVQRFSVDTEAAETYTDTISYTDSGRILQIQRFEVAGVVSDLRDPDARGTLLRVRPDGVSASGLAGPPGSGGEIDEGIVGFSLDATCR